MQQVTDHNAIKDRNVFSNDKKQITCISYIHLELFISHCNLWEN